MTLVTLDPGRMASYRIDLFSSRARSHEAAQMMTSGMPAGLRPDLRARAIVLSARVQTDVDARVVAMGNDVGRAAGAILAADRGGSSVGAALGVGPGAIAAIAAFNAILAAIKRALLAISPPARGTSPPSGSSGPG